jgi:hypothetical protein
MTLLNSANAELAERMANLCDALDDLGQAPKGPMAFLHIATIDHEQAHITRLVQEGTSRIRERAAQLIAMQDDRPYRADADDDELEVAA